MSDKSAEHPFNVRLEPPQNGMATLAELKVIADQLQRTLNAVVRNLTDQDEAVVNAKITGAEIGSLRLDLRPTIAESVEADPDGVCSTLISDINDVWHHRFRPGMTPGLLHQYRTLVNALKESHIQITFDHGAESVTIDDGFRKRFQAATKERIAGKVDIVGRIEALNIHTKPYEIKLFPVLPGADPIVCRFEEFLLGPITDEIKRKSLIIVSGTGYYAPVGLFPIRLTLATAPRRVDFNPDRLRRYVRNTNLVPQGMTASEYLTANRRAVGLEDED